MLCDSKQRCVLMCAFMGGTTQMAETSAYTQAFVLWEEVSGKAFPKPGDRGYEEEQKRGTKNKRKTIQVTNWQNLAGLTNDWCCIQDWLLKASVFWLHSLDKACIKPHNWDLSPTTASHYVSSSVVKRQHSKLSMAPFANQRSLGTSSTLKIMAHYSYANQGLSHKIGLNQCKTNQGCKNDLINYIWFI